LATTTGGHGSNTRRLGTRAAKPKRSPHRAGLLRESIFGINDGLVATVGLVSGEVLSHQPHGSIIIAALSATGAATVSMGIGSFLASSTQNDFLQKQIRDQDAKIQKSPDHERHHVAKLLGDIGLSRATIGPAQREITGSRRRWLRFLVRERLGVHEAQMESPVSNALIMASAVVVGSMPPVVPFLFPLPLVAARNLAWALSLLAAFGIGFGKGVMTASPRWKSGVQFLLLAGASAAVGAGIGLVLAQAGA
jgi:VIT1/CCC1 family predicted Fe2+/Mn2+ transporter